MPTSASALPKIPHHDEPDWRTVYYELDLEALGPTWEAQIAAARAFQDALCPLETPSIRQ